MTSEPETRHIHQSNGRTINIDHELCINLTPIPWCIFHKRSVVFPESGLCADGPVGWWKDD